MDRYEPAVPCWLASGATARCSPFACRSGTGLAASAHWTRAPRSWRCSATRSTSRSTAACAIFDADPVAAFNRFGPHFADEAVARRGGAAIPHAVLAMFVPSSYRRSGRAFTEPRAPEWFRDDPRWMDLCLAPRRHPDPRSIARNALRNGDASRVGGALGHVLLPGLSMTLRCPGGRN